MEADRWTRFAAASRRVQEAQQSRYDPYLGFEEIDCGDEDASRTEYPCPFCSEDLDLVALCLHIDDEHPIEAQNGICPVCADRVGMDMVGHITLQHGNIFKTRRRRRSRKGPSGSNSSLHFKEIKEVSLQAFLDSSFPTYHTPAVAAPDPFLSSLIYTLPVADSSKNSQSESLDEEKAISKYSAEAMIGRSSNVELVLSDKDQKERAQRSEFVQGLLLSTVFEDEL